MLDEVDKWVSRVERISIGIADLSLFAMAVLITLNALFRHLFSDPLPGVINGTRLYLMPAAVLLSLPYLQEQWGNINVDLLYRNFEDVNKNRVVLMTTLIMLPLSLFVVYFSALEAFELWQAGAVTEGVVRYPTAYSWAIITLAFLGLAARMLIQLLRFLVEGSFPGLIEDESSDANI